MVFAFEEGREGKTPLASFRHTLLIKGRPLARAGGGSCHIWPPGVLDVVRVYQVDQGSVLFASLQAVSGWKRIWTMQTFDLVG